MVGSMIRLDLSLEIVREMAVYDVDLSLYLVPRPLCPSSTHSLEET